MVSQAISEEVHPLGYSYKPASTCDQHDLKTTMKNTLPEHAHTHTMYTYLSVFDKVQVEHISCSDSSLIRYSIKSFTHFNPQRERFRIPTTL